MRRKTMDRNIDTNRRNNAGHIIDDITRFRKKYRLFGGDAGRDVKATNDEFKNAVNLGVDNNLGNVSIRDIKDHFNAMTNWVKNNSAEIDKLAEYEKKTLIKHQREVSSYYQNYQGAKRIYSEGISDAAAQFRQAFKSYALYTQLMIIPRLDVRSLDE